MNEETEEFNHLETVLSEKENNINDDEENSEDDDEPEISTVDYACEDCDYRWDVTVEIFPNENQHNNSKEKEYCPMCGSSNALQI